MDHNETQRKETAMNNEEKRVRELYMEEDDRYDNHPTYAEVANDFTKTIKRYWQIINTRRKPE